MTEQSTYGRYSKQKYQQQWKTVNVKPDTKLLLKELVDKLSTDLAVAPMSTVLDQLVREKHAQVFKK